MKSYKFRIYPSKTQEALLSKTFGCVRYFWNHQVATFNTYDKEMNPKPQFKSVRDLREELNWMRDISFCTVQQKERDFDKFRKQFFSSSRETKMGFPKFKKKSGRQSFRLSNVSFKIVKNKIRLQKIGNVKFVQDRDFPEFFKLMSVTISRNPSGEYYASICIEQEINHKPKTGKDVGLDVGIKTFSTQSDGIEIDNPKYFSKNQAKLKRLQQHHVRKQKGSKRREKCRLKIAKLHQKITNQRNFFLHNYSTYLVNHYDTIYIEDLDVKGLLEKKQMSKNIADASWSEFFKMLRYKADWYGKEVYKVDRYYASSKTCGCGVKNKELKLSDRIWICKSCGTENKRDELASKNILKEGRRSLGDQVKTDVESKVMSSEKR